MFDRKNIKPMLVSEIPFAFENKYLYEIKFDGIRALIYVNKNNISIRTRNNVDITHLFLELHGIKNIVGRDTCIFDGEIVLFDRGRPSFSSLQKRLRIKNKDRIKAVSLDNPVQFVVFDIIYQNRDLTNKTLVERKKILDKYKDTDYVVKSKVYSDGEKLFTFVKKLELEGAYHKYTNAGHISYIELDGDPSDNLEAFESIVRIMKECDIGYGAINHPVDRDPVCGYVGIIKDVCPRCGRHTGEAVSADLLKQLEGKN